MTTQVQQPGSPAGDFTLLPVTVQYDRRITEFSFILAVLFLLDIITTQVILWLGGIEMNPAMSGFVQDPLLHLAVKAATLLLIILVSLFAETKVKGSSIGFYCVIIVLYIFVLVNNVFVLIPHTAGFWFF